jgi:holo-[acyl-carrier protein] synthase
VLFRSIFHTDERDAAPRTLAGRFAAKEALIKVFGDSKPMRWHDVRVSKDELGKPFIELFDGTAEYAASRGIKNLHLSISHDGNSAIAFLVAEDGA